MEIGTTSKPMSLKSKIVFGSILGLIGTLVMIVSDYGLDSIEQLHKYIFNFIFLSLFTGTVIPYILLKYGKTFTDKLTRELKPKLNSNENIEIKGPANMFKKYEALGGKIFLTNKRLIFKSHNLNIQNNQTNIEYSQINEIKSKDLFGNPGSKLELTTKNKTLYKFVVNDPKTWIEKINERIKRNTA